MAAGGDDAEAGEAAEGQDRDTQGEAGGATRQGHEAGRQKAQAPMLLVMMMVMAAK